MGKHTPLPTDPDARAAEKKRRFAAYHREWRLRRRAMQREQALAKAKTRMKLLRAAHRAGIDLVLGPHNLTNKQLKAAIAKAEIVATGPA